MHGNKLDKSKIDRTLKMAFLNNRKMPSAQYNPYAVS